MRNPKSLKLKKKRKRKKREQIKHVLGNVLRQEQSDENS